MRLPTAHRSPHTDIDAASRREVCGRPASICPVAATKDCPTGGLVDEEPSAAQMLGTGRNVTYPTVPAVICRVFENAR
jgi:hypothetical protein